jgi:hypothetical protein
MKIKIGPYNNYVGPYQIAEKILFFIPKYKGKNHLEYNEAYEKYVDSFGKWLSEDKDGNDTWLTKLCFWIESKRKRTIKVKIDRWDTWSMDHTLALIILPMLKQLNETNHGAPNTDDEDVPEQLRSTSVESKENEWDVDSNHFKRWDWIMNEMIWSFEQLVDDSSEDKFHKDVFDKEGFLEHKKRVDNGLRLFGKYYRGLWD